MDFELSPDKVRVIFYPIHNDPVTPFLKYLLNQIAVVAIAYVSSIMAMRDRPDSRQPQVATHEASKIFISDPVKGKHLILPLEHKATFDALEGLVLHSFERDPALVDICAAVAVLAALLLAFLDIHCLVVEVKERMFLFDFALLLLVFYDPDGAVHFGVHLLDEGIR